MFQRRGYTLALLALFQVYVHALPLDRILWTTRSNLGASRQRRWVPKEIQRQSRLMASSKNIGGIITRKKVLLALGGVVLGLPVALETYSRSGFNKSEMPSSWLSPLPKGKWEDVEHVTLVFHGAGGQDQYTDALLENLKRQEGKSSYTSIIEWSSFSKNILRASFNGQKIGSMAASQLLELAPNLKSVHMIGISVGAFAADSASRQIRATRGESPFIQLTLLDPFTQRGILDVGYGAREYGKSADYFQQFLNTDDPVPSTNAPLPNSVCFDITAIRPDEISFGHDWPVAHYARQVNTGIVRPEKRLERGTVVQIER